MALKLISILSVVIFISFAYKVWDKTKIPTEIPLDDAWKVKTIEFVCRICEKLIDFVRFMDKDVHELRPYITWTYRALHYGIWPLHAEKRSGASLVTRKEMEMEGVRVILYQRHKHVPNMNRPVLIYFHGGGWEWLGVEDPSPTLKSLARDLGIVTISVDYRLAPEHPYPAALDDCLAVTEYVIFNHQKLGLDNNNVMVGGDNSGGNLAAAVALKLRKRLKLQILINPVLQAFDFKTPSYRENGAKLKYIMQPEKMVRSIIRYGGGGIPEARYMDLLNNRHMSYLANNERYRDFTNTKHIPDYNVHVSNLTTLPASYYSGYGDFHLSHLVEGLFLDPFFMPLMSSNLDSNTDAYIVTSQHDIVRDDGLIYAARLAQAWNVNVKLEHYKDGFHNFFHYSEGPLKLQAASRALNNLTSYIRSHIITSE